MNPTTLVKILDVSDQPLVKMSLPPSLRVGDRVNMKFTLRRIKNRRNEVLEVDQEFRVSSSILDQKNGVFFPRIEIESVGVVPAWKAVKKLPETSRKLAPAKSRPIVVS